MLVTRIKQIAKEKGLKMSDIAHEMGINPVNFSASINRNPTLGEIIKINNRSDILRALEMLDKQR